MAFAPTKPWKLPFITTWGGSPNRNLPTNSAEEAEIVHQFLHTIRFGTALEEAACEPLDVFRVEHRAIGTDGLHLVGDALKFGGTYDAEQSLSIQRIFRENVPAAEFEICERHTWGPKVPRQRGQVQSQGQG